MDMSKTPCLHADLSPVVQRCCDARNRIFRDAAASLRPAPTPQTPPLTPLKFAELIAKAAANRETIDAATAAYRYAMPDPSTRQGLKDYIACVLHGMTVDAISRHEGAALLAGARIALAGHRGKSHKSAQKANTQLDTENQQQPAA